MEEEPDPWSGAPTPERGAASAAASGLAAGIGGGALGRLMNGISGAAGAATTGNLIG